MRLEMEPESKARLDEFCHRSGMTKVAATSRLIDWFSRQPDTVQAMIQGLFPSPIEAEVATIVLKRMAGQGISKQKTSMKYPRVSAKGHFLQTRPFRTLVLS
jgi:hypothetical protein